MKYLTNRWNQTDYLWYFNKFNDLIGLPKYLNLTNKRRL